MHTRAEQLTYAIAYALRRVRLPGRRTLSEAERYSIAETVAAKLRESGDPWKLSEPTPAFFHKEPTTGYR